MHTIGIIIERHRSLTHLRRCVESILSQSLIPSEILVVERADDDSAHDLVADLDANFISRRTTLRIDRGETWRLAIEELRSDLLVILEDDGRLLPEYCATAVRMFSADYRLGFVYPDLRRRGLLSGTTHFPTDTLEADLLSENFIHSGSIFSRKAIIAANVSIQSGIGKDDEEWRLARQIAEIGFWGVKHTISYDQEIDAKSRSTIKPQSPKGRGAKNLSEESKFPLLLFVSGDTALWKHCANFLESLSFPRDRVTLTIVSPTMPPGAFDAIRRWCRRTDYTEMRLLPDVRPPQSKTAGSNSGQKVAVPTRKIGGPEGISDPLSSLYKVSLRETFRRISPMRSPFVVLLHERLLPTAEGLTELIGHFDPKKISVAATIETLADHRVVAWGREGIAESPREETVSGTHLGCTVVNTRALLRYLDGAELLPDSMLEFALQFASSARAHGTASLLGSVTCGKIAPREDPLVALTPEIFDEEFYLRRHEEVREAIHRGECESGFTHFVNYGIAERRAARLRHMILDDEDYLKTHRDVAAAIERGECSSGSDHLMKVGVREDRAARFIDPALDEIFVRRHR